MNGPERNRFVQAIQHEIGVAADMRTLSKFVREQIFYVFVHDFKDDKDDCLSAEGDVCQEFIESYFDIDHNESILNPCLQNATDEEIRAYLKWLWKEGLKPTTKGRGNIRRDLSNEKSAVYAAISEAFKSKSGQRLLHCRTNIGSSKAILVTCAELVLQCIVAKQPVPIPAFETLEDRVNLPRRYFLFFDVFFQAGRHNKELWKVAITKEKGNNGIPFGSCIFEAHVRTTLRENYFKWLLQVLSNPRLVNDEQLEGWKTEYDYESSGSFPKRLICDTPLVALPVECQMEFDSEASVFKILTNDDEDSDDENPPRLLKDVQDEQAILVKDMVFKNRAKHQHMLKVLREKIAEIRALEVANAKRDDIKKALLSAKKRLCVFDDDLVQDQVQRPLAKRRRKSVENKSRNSDKKLDFFGKACIALQREEDAGYRKAWENAYKDLKNHYITETSDSNEDENVENQIHLLKHSTLLTNLKNCRVWRKAAAIDVTNTASI